MNSLMEGILRVCLLSAHLKLKCEYFLAQVTTKITIQTNKKYKITENLAMALFSPFFTQFFTIFFVNGNK
jgi:hypothetical protein